MSDALLIGRPSDAALTLQLASTTLHRGGRGWKLAFTVAGLGTALLFGAISYTIAVGIGVWGNNIPVGWAFGIINFVWWVGIGHAGTFISAILLLLEQDWRTSINRFAEGMTLFAVIQACLFPLLHLGRPWFAYWLFPYPSTMDVWPQLKSALPWDAAALTTYFTVSLLFWYLGLIPDLAVVRDTAPTRLRRRIYGVFALGWRGSARAWAHYRVAYGLLAGISAPLVLSVHSIVSSDFAITQLPGWHSTIFPPFFVTGAIFSGFAMVILLMIPARNVFGLHNVITTAHLDKIAKVLLLTSWIVTYSYVIELFIAWYSGDVFEVYQHWVARTTGPNAAIFWIMVFANVVVPQVFWWRSMRVNTAVLFVASLLISVGMWAERFVIIVLGLQRGFLPSSWRAYAPTWVDLAILSGTLCFFSLLFMVFLRLVPFIPISELKQFRRELANEVREPAETP